MSDLQTAVAMYAELSAKNAELKAERDEALDALAEDGMLFMPPPDAICHVGIVDQSECAYCNRIARKIAILRKAGRLP